MDRDGKPQMETEVRQALSYAVDKDAFNEAVFGGTNIPAASPLMKPTFAYEPKTEDLYTYDLDKAQAMLDEAGWVLNGDIREKDGQKLELYWPYQDRENDRNMATFIQGAWREIGVDVQVGADGTRQPDGNGACPVITMSPCSGSRSPIRISCAASSIRTISAPSTTLAIPTPMSMRWLDEGSSESGSRCTHRRLLPGAAQGGRRCHHHSAGRFDHVQRQAGQSAG